MAEINPEDQALLTTTELARELHVSPRTVEGWRRHPGKGPRFLKIGTARSARVLYRRGDVNDWKETLVRESTTE